MKRIINILTLLSLSAILTIPVVTQAAEKKAKNEIVMKMGSKVHLFHSSDVEAQKEIAVNDVLPVYRMNMKTRQDTEVGAVKVLSFMGKHYFEAEIIKGGVKIGDIAKKADASLLVQPAK